MIKEITSLEKVEAPGKVVLFSGSFDPPHQGHFNMAEFTWQEIFKEGKETEIWLRPHHFNPQKTPQASLEDKIEMLRKGLEGRKGKYRLLNLKKDYGDLCFFYEVLRSTFPRTNIYLLRGLEHIKGYSLKDNSAYLAINHIIYIKKNFSFGYANLGWAEGTEIIVKEEWWQMSSTEVRRRLRSRQSVEGLLPEGVINYIQSKGLYTSNLNSENTGG